MLKHRLFHYAVLLVTTAILTLPKLGAHDLCDVDEGVNAEASREMMEFGTWITPLFNFELRTAKPVLLYWLQIASYSLFGVDEFAARLPSVLAAMASVLLVYELARQMFDCRTGLLAGIILTSSIEFCMLAHAATPDSMLLFFTLLTFYLFWIGSRGGSRAWFVSTGMAAGLAVLTKGPVGVVLPVLVIFSYFAWNRELWRLLDRRAIWGFLAFLAVAAPWYVAVTLDTRGAWIKQFLGHENIGRFLTPLEQHRGPFYYHVVGITVLFAPWSVFFLANLWHHWKSFRKPPQAESTPEAQADDTLQAHRFLLCWAGAYLVFFSLAATKLPNYVLAVYPALAIFTARCLEQWRSGAANLPHWVVLTSISVFGCVGLLVIAGFALLGGILTLPIGGIQVFPGLAQWSWLGIIPLAGAIVAWLSLRRRLRGRMIGCIAASSVAFVALMAAYPVEALDEQAAPKQLVEKAGLRQPHRDIRLVSIAWFEPSIVFYTRREVEKIDGWEQLADIMRTKQQVYLLVPDRYWNEMQVHPEKFDHRIVAQQYDYHKNCNVLVVSNQ